MAATIYYLLSIFYFQHGVYKSAVLVPYAFVLCLPEDGDLLPKHVGELTCNDNFRLSIKLFAIVGVYGWVASICQIGYH
jgi:hypothetical protein